MADFETANTGQPAPNIVQGRECGTCSLCCKVFRIAETGSDAGQWCRHCMPRKGCAIYETRPDPCRGYFCMWMTQPGLGPEWKPERSKLVLSIELNGQRIAAHVDPSVPGAWRRSPYYEDLKRWSVEGVQVQRQVSVWVGQHCIVILPDKEIDLGVVTDDEVVVSTAQVTQSGPVYGAEKMKRAEAEARQRQWAEARRRFEAQKGDGAAR